MMNKLKDFDIFSSVVPTFVTYKDRKNNKKTYREKHSSIMGGVLSILTVIASTVYLTLQVIAMMNQKFDF